MNKKIGKVLEEKGLIVEKNRAYGVIDGYEVSASYHVFDLSTPVHIYISCNLSDEHKEFITGQFKNVKYGFISFSFSKYGIIIKMNGWTAKSTSKRLKEFLEMTITLLKNMNIKGITHSPLSGVEMENPKLCDLNEYKVTINEDEYIELKNKIDSENEAYDNQPTNYIMGFFGACLGGLIGGVLCFIFLRVGFISGFCGYLAAYLGTKFYKSMKAKTNKMMILIVGLTSLVMILLSVILAYLLVSDGVNGFVRNMSDSKFRVSFIYDMTMSFIFTGLGLIYPIYLMNKETKRIKID